jgi:ABC-type sulfate transport system substrate-binding protein
MNNIKSIAAAALLAVSGLTVSAQTMLNASYDVAREFYKEYNAAFVANYKKTTGKDLKIDQAHGGSSAQARAVNDDLDADVLVTFESEVISVDNEFGTGKVDAIHPSISIVAENPVAVVHCERSVWLIR